MNELLKVLIADEKKIDKLTVGYNQLRKNIANETEADAKERKHLSVLIATIKKSNSVIVNHCLGEHKLSLTEIHNIVNREVLS